MADSTFEVREFRAIIKPEWTELYIKTGPASDGMLGVGGWYKKILPASQPALPVLEEAFQTTAYLVEWDRGIPS